MELAYLHGKLNDLYKKNNCKPFYLKEWFDMDIDLNLLCDMEAIKISYHKDKCEIISVMDIDLDLFMNGVHATDEKKRLSIEAAIKENIPISQICLEFNIHKRYVYGVKHKLKKELLK